MRWLSNLDLRQFILLGVAVRVLFCLVGAVHDSLSPAGVKYTDIDFSVVMDGTNLLCSGASPFDRATYRYTPLLAVLWSPSCVLGSWYARAILIVADVATAVLLRHIARSRGDPDRYVLYGYLLNPLIINISTRGNADVLVVMLVVYVLFLATTSTFKGKTNLSNDEIDRSLSDSAMLGAVFGLAVHVKIYPVVYGLSLLLHLWHKHATYSPLQRRLSLAAFLLGAAASFFVLLSFFYNWFGYPFLHEAYLYHVSRSDHRHNFSVYFYQVYQQTAGIGGTGAESDLYSKVMSKVLVLLPQAIINIGIALRLARRDLAVCMCLQTWAFVTLNTVVTAQYFSWYVALLPLVLPRVRLSYTHGLTLLGVWFLAEVHWLYWGYQLEFVGYTVYFQLFCASAIFLLVNCGIIGNLFERFMHHHIETVSPQPQLPTRAAEPTSKRTETVDLPITRTAKRTQITSAVDVPVAPSQDGEWDWKPLAAILAGVGMAAWLAISQSQEAVRARETVVPEWITNE